MSEVVGQEYAKWAMEVAAAGGHHLLMTRTTRFGQDDARLAYAGHHVPIVGIRAA